MSRLHCETRENLKAQVARTARRYIEAVDLRKDAEQADELEPARLGEREALREYKAARAALEQHYQDHNCLE